MLGRAKITAFATAITLCLLVLAACTPEDSKDPQTPAEIITQAESQAPPPVLSPEELAPVIREVAEADVGPTKIVIELAKPVIEEAQVGEKAGDGTVLKIEPEVEGQLSFTGRSTLTFVPTKGFAPGTKYEVELMSLATPVGVLEAPEAGRWVRVFTSPDFAFARFSLASVDYPRKRAEAHLVFSGPVDPREVQKRARLVISEPQSSGRRTPTVRFRPGPQPHTVLAQLTGDLIRGGSRLDLVLEDGTPSAINPRQRAARRTASVDLAMGPVAKIVDTYRAEGTSGFYVQVICDDSAVDSRRYYWDRVQHEYHQLSTRCQLDEADAAFGIHFEPEVNYSVSPAGGGFRIFGDFERGSYHMRIEAGVRTADGGMLHQAYTTDFSVPARSPSVRFVSKGRYLPRAAWTSLPVRHLNLSGATLSVRHVPPENLVFWMSDDASEAANERNSNLILKTEIALRGESDVETTTYVDLGSLVPADTKGLIELRLAGGNARDTARILLTDLHLVAKRMSGHGEVEPNDGKRHDFHAWALHSETLEPIRGAELRLIRKSGHMLASCYAGGDGGCQLSPPADEVDPSPPFALLAVAGNDLTYLKLAELKAEVQEARISGAPYRDEVKYRAAIYSDRGVYRPGETAHLAAIVRQQDHLAARADMPVIAKLIDPRGKTLKRTTLKTNAAGYVELDVGFPAFAATGRYLAQLEVAEKQIGEYRFQVEEFVPERMKVEVRPVAANYLYRCSRSRSRSVRAISSVACQQIIRSRSRARSHHRTSNRPRTPIFTTGSGARRPAPCDHWSSAP